MNFPSGIIIFCLFLLKSKTGAHEVSKGTAFEHIWSGPPVMDTYNDYEEMQRYISTKRNIDTIKNPAMDSYITAYNIYHENCQIKHEKDKQDKIKKNVKRSAPSLPEFIKFELSDAKEPDEATKEYFRRQQKNLEFSTQNPGQQQQHHHHEFEESENITEEAVDKDSPSPHETRKVPVYRLMDHRKIKKSIKNFPEDIQNAINRAVLENKHGNYPRHIIPGYNGKLRFGDKLQKHEPNPGKYPAILFNEINLRAEQFLNKHKYTPEQDVFYHPAPQPYVSAYVAAPAEELQPVVAAHFRAPAPEIDPVHPVHPGAAAAAQPVQVVPAVPEIHYVIKEVPAHALSPSEAASQQQHLSGPITTQNKIAHHRYEYVGDVPIRAPPLEQQHHHPHHPHHHHHHHHQEQQVSYVANLEKQVIKEHNPYPTSEEQLTQNVQRPANLKPLHVADDSEYNALSSLIGKSPADQIQGLTYLIAKENAQGQQPKRPQDNTAPILFHPERANRNRVQPMQQDDSVKTQYNAINGVHGHYVHQKAEYKPVTEAPEKDSGEVVKERVPVVHLAPIVIPTSYKNVHYGGLSPNYEDVEHGAKELRYASRYAFGYRVRDFHTGNDFGHKQNRDIDGVTRGEYHILLPDGRIQNVVYHADESGFHADVSFETGH